MRKTSIADVFQNHQSELFALCNSPQQFKELQAYVNKLLDSEELRKNSSVPEAREIFKRGSYNWNLYISILMTYLTGIKVSF